MHPLLQKLHHTVGLCNRCVWIENLYGLHCQTVRLKIGEKNYHYIYRAKVLFQYVLILILSITNKFSNKVQLFL